MIPPANAMSNSVTPPPEPVQIVLVRKLMLLSLLMIVAALGLVLLLRNISLFSLFLPHILSDAAMGLIAGFSVRWILRKQMVFLRFISALAFLIGGLELLGWFTGWQIGLGPLILGHASVDWYSLGQLLLGTGISLLALYAWTPSAPVVVDPAPTPKSIDRSPRRGPRPGKRLRRSSGSREQSSPAAVFKQSAGPIRKRSSHRKPRLQLSGEVEHRCPYCLELVDLDDPRGTVECKICHTLHHADCWAITGACQVPHYTT